MKSPHTTELARALVKFFQEYTAEAKRWQRTHGAELSRHSGPTASVHCT